MSRIPIKNSKDFAAEQTPFWRLRWTGGNLKDLKELP